jgi:hypothetical protein
MRVGASSDYERTDSPWLSPQTSFPPGSATNDGLFCLTPSMRWEFRLLCSLRAKEGMFSIAPEHSLSKSG